MQIVLIARGSAVNGTTQPVILPWNCS